MPHTDHHFTHIRCQLFPEVQAYNSPFLIAAKDTLSNIILTRHWMGARLNRFDMQKSFKAMKPHTYEAQMKPSLRTIVKECVSLRAKQI